MEEGKETETTPDITRKIYEDVMAIYPFLTPEEQEDFTKKAAPILDNEEKVSELEQVKKIIGLLNNPHADVTAKELEGKPVLKPEFKIENEIAYLTIPNWNDKVKGEIEEIKKACLINRDNYRAVIIDVRGNRGGNSKWAHDLGMIFFREEVPYGKLAYREEGGELKEKEIKMRADAENYIEKPIAILIDHKCFSSNELFLAPFKISKRATLIGTRTSGGSGNPKSIPINIEGKDYVVRIPQWRLFLKGEEKPIEETGITPDIDYTESDIVEFAKKYLKEKLTSD